MSMMRSIPFSIAVAGLIYPVIFPQTALAENLSSRWTIDQYTKSRLFVGGYDTEKKILHLGWQLSLKDGWKTYWRTPGDAGLPPHWSWKEKRNVNTITVKWPKPELYHIFNMDTFIYHDEITLPIEVKITDSGEPVSLALDLQYLICADVCIPQEGSYRLEVSSLTNIKISRFQKAQLNRYRDLVPVKIPGEDILAASDKEQPDILTIHLPESYAQVEDIIVEGPDGILFGRATSTGKGRFEVSYNKKHSLAGQNLTLTLLLKNGGANEAKVTVHQR